MNKLSAERLAELRRYRGLTTDTAVNAVSDLLRHIAALDSELTALREALREVVRAADGKRPHPMLLPTPRPELNAAIAAARAMLQPQPDGGAQHPKETPDV